MYHYLIGITIVMLLLVTSKNEVSDLINTPYGKLAMIIFLILAINKNIFLGLFVLLTFLLLLENSTEGFDNKKNKKRRKKNKDLEMNYPKDDIEYNEEMNDVPNETTTSPKLEKSNEQEINLSKEEVEVLKKLMAQRSKKSSCKKTCGNALLSCLDGCKLSDKMRKPVSSKDFLVTNNQTTENVEPSNTNKEGFTNWN